MKASAAQLAVLAGLALVTACGSGSSPSLTDAPTLTRLSASAPTNVSCSPAQERKAGPLNLNVGRGLICWTDLTTAASFRVEGAVHYTNGCDAIIDGLIQVELPFAVSLPANSIVFRVPEPSDPRISFMNSLTATVDALDSAAIPILTDGASLQVDPSCDSPAPTG